MTSPAYISLLSELENVSSSSILTSTQDKFYSALETQCKLLQCEQKPFTVTSASIPATLSINDFVFYSRYISAELGRCYVKTATDYSLVSSGISDSDATKIYCAIYLQRRNVVWIDFGFNVGREFGGKHPAIILKNIMNETLVVLPVSTNKSGKVGNDTTIVFSPTDLCSMPSIRDRITYINRITNISVYRVDVTSPVGSLKEDKFEEIITKLNNYFK